MNQEIEAARRQQITETPISMLDTLDKWRGQQFVQKDMELWGWHPTKTHMEITLMLRMQVSMIHVCFVVCSCVSKTVWKQWKIKRSPTFGKRHWFVGCALNKNTYEKFGFTNGSNVLPLLYEVASRRPGFGDHTKNVEVAKSCKKLWSRRARTQWKHSSEKILISNNVCFPATMSRRPGHGKLKHERCHTSFITSSWNCRACPRQMHIQRHCWFQKGQVVFPYALWSCGLKARAWRGHKL